MKAKNIGNTAVSGIALDPRTKILLLFTVSFFVVGGLNGGIMTIIRPTLAAVPLLLLIGQRKLGGALAYGIVYALCFTGDLILLSMVRGTVNLVVVAICGLVSRILPGIITGYFVVTTTKVSEFVAAMEKLHMTDKITIPMSVMFRFFPTLKEEFDAIGDAMRMRGIRFGGKKSFSMLEYRFVPMMTCSVKIGEELSAAALTRGLGAPVKRTNICKIGFRPVDRALILLCIVSFICFVLHLFGLA